MLTPRQLTPPEERLANMHYRKQVRKWALDDAMHRDYLIKRCRDDFFFWIKTFGFILNPRAKKDQSQLLPFIPYSHQIPVFQALIDNFGDRDIGICKGRAQGATYMCLNIFLWHWMFFENQELAMVSRNEQTADDPLDPSSLGAKLDYGIKLLPEWMVGVKNKVWIRNVARHSWSRNDNGSTIVAYPTTGNVGSGARKRCVFIDEFAKHQRGDDANLLISLGPVTNCRLLVSTYFGRDGAYYEAMTQPSSMVKLSLMWQDNPEHNENLFRLDYKNHKILAPKEDAEILPTYSKDFFAETLPILENRGFKLDSLAKIWSPWYISECTRPGSTPVSIAQEHDADPAGSSSRFIDYQVIDRLVARCKPPKWRGVINYVYGSLQPERLIPSHAGPLKIWFPEVGGKGWKPPYSEYVLGCDVAAGTGTSQSSNSVISILDRNTGVKAGEFCSNNITPDRLAETAIAIARLFYDAFIAWERNGPGVAFATRVIDSDYRNIYFQTQQQSVRRKQTKVPGWWSDKNSKIDLLSRYRTALIDGLFENPCEAAILEAGQYGEISGNRLAFIPVSAVELDPSDEGDSHGDRVIADALANFMMEYLGGNLKNKTVTQRQSKREKPPIGSFGQRREQYRHITKKEQDDKKYW